jgi:hypothetical protein
MFSMSVDKIIMEFHFSSDITDRWPHAACGQRFAYLWFTESVSCRKLITSNRFV